MNLGLAEVRGALLVISQFTLYGDAAKGRRPSFIDAARPETAIPLYERFLAALRRRGFAGGHRRVRRRHAGRDPQRRTRHPHPGPRMTPRAADPRLLLPPPPAAARDAGHPGPGGALEHSRGAPAGRDADGLRGAAGAGEGAQRSRATWCSAPTPRSWCGTRCWRSRSTPPTRSGCCSKLQGRTHQVVTSVALVADEAVHQATDVTNVAFRRLDDAFLEAYVATGEPMDKAGRVRHPGIRRGAGGADRRRLLQRDGTADPAGARTCCASGPGVPVRK